jgi:Arc/MetJ family transcription regulator
MKTTVDIPERLLKEAMRNTKASTKRDAVVTALENYNRRCRLRRLADSMGKSDTFMTHEELMEMRNAELKEWE